MSTLPSPMAIAATSAATNAADGSKNAAYLSSIQSDIGANYTRRLTRDGVTVWSATQTGTLPISNSAFVLPTTATQTSISTADIDTGTWEHRIESATDPAKYIATGVTAIGGGGPLTLSGDLVAGGTLSLGSVLLNSPPFDSAPVLAPTASDPRVVNWVDPNVPFSQVPLYQGRYQNYQPNGNLTDVSEPGILGRLANGTPATDYALLRAAHPVAAGQMGYRHRIRSDWQVYGPSYGDTTYRSEILQPGEGVYTINRGVTYWVALSFTYMSDILAVGADEMSLLDLHVIEDAGDGFGPGPLAFFLDNGNATFQLRYNPNNPTIPANSTIVASYTFSPTASVEYQLVMQVRVNFAGNGLCNLWVRPSNTNVATQVVNYAGPLGYNDANTYTYLKTGIYFFGAPNGWGGANERTLWTRGFKVLRDEPGTPTLNQQSMFATF